MDKELLENNNGSEEINSLASNEYEGLSALEIWEKLYNKELNSKKSILEYIDITRMLKKSKASEEQIRDTYNFIYEQIEGLKDSIKPNTMMFLKNNLKSQLGKYVKEKDPRPVNHFIEFFKEAYPENNRRKDFTWVLMDINNISEDQIWTTLAHINRECLTNKLRLNAIQKKDIIEMVEKLVSKNNIKYINNLRSLKQLTDKLGVSIVSADKGFKMKHK